jgi:hypothetical protein
MFMLTGISLLLTACPFGNDADDGMPKISVTNLGDAASVETPDVTIMLFGTVDSEEPITSVQWQNDRGGNGVASGTRNWATGHIRLESGANNITLTASDATGNKTSKSIVVERKPPGSGGTGSGNGNGPNSAPTISGSPGRKASVNVGYRFQPSASDADNDSLTFSIENKPAWAKFDPQTGLLDGVPGDAHIGTHPGIRITVSDGKLSATLPTFGIDVVGFANGSATLTWNPPTHRTDDTPLNGLAGYEIEYSLLSGNFENKITIKNPGTATDVVDNLAPGSWKFVVRAVDTTGQLSARSGEGQKTIQ